MDSVDIIHQNTGSNFEFYFSHFSPATSRDKRFYVFIWFFFFLSTTVKVCCHSLTLSCLEPTEATTPSNFSWTPHLRLHIGFIIHTRTLCRMKVDTNENYDGLIGAKSPRETGHLITLLILFILSFGISNNKSLVFSGYWNLCDNLIKSEWAGC